MFNLAPLINQFNQFTHSQSLHQQQQIALLKQIHFELQQINQKLENQKIC